MKRFLHSAKYILLISILGLSSCGYKGPLYLPEEPESNQPASPNEGEQDDGESAVREEQ